MSRGTGDGFTTVVVWFNRNRKDEEEFSPSKIKLNLKGTSLYEHYPRIPS